MAILSIRNWRFILVWVGLLALSVVLVGRPSFGSRPAAQGKTLKVLTYNVAHFGLDKAGVMKVLTDSDADIICLQEACRPEAQKQTGEALCREMKGYHYVSGSSNMILSRHTITLVRSVDVPTKWPTKEFPEALVETPLGKVRVMSVHLEPSWVSSFPPNMAEYVPTIAKVVSDRRAQIDIVLAAMRPSKEPIVLAGDFNGPASSESIQRLGAYFTDCYGATEKGFGNTLMAKYPYKRIDYVWTRNLIPISTEVLDSTASDHCPVLTILGEKYPAN